MRTIALTLASSLVFVACSFVRDFEGFDTGAPDGSRPLDPPADAGGDGGGAPSNLRPNGDFESGCQGWRAFQGTIEPSAIVRGGKMACRVCPDETGFGNFSIGGSDPIVEDPPPGSEYRVEAWFRKDPARPALGSAGVLLRTSNADPFVEIEKRFSQVELVEEWRRGTTSLPVTQRAELLDISLSGERASGGCFLVDDVAVVRVR